MQINVSLVSASAIRLGSKTYSDWFDLKADMTRARKSNSLSAWKKDTLGMPKVWYDDGFFDEGLRLEFKQAYGGSYYTNTAMLISKEGAPKLMSKLRLKGPYSVYVDNGTDNSKFDEPIPKQKSGKSFSNLTEAIVYMRKTYGSGKVN